MITERMSNKSFFQGQKIRFRTELFGKDYFWMEDIDGTTYLARAVPNVVGSSVGPDGKAHHITDGMVPKLI